MGHFSVSCGISRLSIPYGKVVLVPLVKARFNELSKLAGSYTCSNEGSEIFFKPATLPIFGEYNTYGTLENIERDMNVERIEAHYGISIDDFVEGVARGGAEEDDEEGGDKPKTKRPAPPTVGMFIDREIWDHMKTQAMDTWPSRVNSAYAQGDVTSAAITELGFTLQKVLDRGRYNMVFEKDGVTVHSDGTWISDGPEMSDRAKFGNVYRIEEFVRRCKRLKVKFDPEVIKRLQDRSMAEQWILAAREKHNAKQGRFQELEEMALFLQETMPQRSAEILDILEAAAYDFDYDDKGDLLHLGAAGAPLYRALINDDAYIKMRAELLTVSRNMYGVNAFWFPSFSGLQDGDPRLEQGLHALCQKILRKRLKGEEE